MIGLSLIFMANLCVGQTPDIKLTDTPSSVPALTATPISREVLPVELSSSPAAPLIHDIRLNTSDYPNGQIPQYSKLEITFQVDTAASNLQLPYDAAPPPGVQPGMGISVDALFSRITGERFTTSLHFIIRSSLMRSRAAGMVLSQR